MTFFKSLQSLISLFKSEIFLSIPPPIPLFLSFLGSILLLFCVCVCVCVNYINYHHLYLEIYFLQLFIVKLKLKTHSSFFLFFLLFSY